MGKVIEEVQSGKSDLGIIFLSSLTKTMLLRIFFAKNLEFHEIKQIRPHVFLNRNHPLATKAEIAVEELAAYPYVVFTNKDESSLDFSEEIIPQQNMDFTQIIYINDRTTFYNILSHTNALSTGSGVLPEGYCDPMVCAVPIASCDDTMQIGWLKKKDAVLSPIASEFLDLLKEIMRSH